MPFHKVFENPCTFYIHSTSQFNQTTISSIQQRRITCAYCKSMGLDSKINALDCRVLGSAAPEVWVGTILFVCTCFDFNGITNRLVSSTKNSSEVTVHKIGYHHQNPTWHFRLTSFTILPQRRLSLPYLNDCNFLSSSFPVPGRSFIQLSERLS